MGLTRLFQNEVTCGKCGIKGIGPWGPGEVKNAKLFLKIYGLDETIP